MLAKGPYHEETYVLGTDTEGGGGWGWCSIPVPQGVGRWGVEHEEQVTVTMLPLGSLWRWSLHPALWGASRGAEGLQAATSNGGTIGAE